jgi:hypothetical protein
MLASADDFKPLTKEKLLIILRSWEKDLIEANMGIRSPKWLCEFLRVEVSALYASVEEEKDFFK